MKGFESIPNASERASLAMDIFGKGGVKILNTLGSGSKTLEELSAEARNLGISVSLVDQSRIAMAKDALDRVGGAIEGIGNSITIKLAPYIESAAKQMVDWFASVDVKGKDVEYVFDVIAGAIAKVVGVCQTLAIKTLEVFKGITSGVSATIRALTSLAEAINAIAPSRRSALMR